jgi:electron transfer flavoprotein beta subunit
MVAQLIGSGQATYASSISFIDDQWVVDREVDGGSQTLALSVPAVVTCDLRLNEPRYASLPNIMKAKKKPLEVIAADTLGVSVKEHVRLLEVAPPPVRKAGIKVGSVSELVDKLKNVAGVI